MRRRLIAVVAAVAGVSAALIAVSGGGAANKMATPVKVTVTMSDFKYKLSRTSVPKNTPIVFTVVNKGPSPHDFAFAAGKKTPVKPSGTTTTLKVTFTKAGKMRYLCTVPRHASFGMVGNLTVK